MEPTQNNTTLRDFLKHINTVLEKVKNRKLDGSDQHVYDTYQGLKQAAEQADEVHKQFEKKYDIEAGTTTYTGTIKSNLEALQYGTPLSEIRGLRRA